MQIDIGTDFWYEYTFTNGDASPVIDAVGEAKLYDMNNNEVYTATYTNNGDGTYEVEIPASETLNLTEYKRYRLNSVFTRPLGDREQSDCTLTAGYKC